MGRDVTMRDVAHALGVDASTVSRALDPARPGRVSDDMRQLVLAKADELGYRPDLVAAGLRRRKTATVGVIVADLGNPFISPVIWGITNALESRQMMPLINETRDDYARFDRILEHMLSRRVDAIITTASRYGDGDVLAKAQEAGVPVILAVRQVPGARLPSVTHDDVGGGRMVADYLIRELGHVRVAQLKGPGDASSFVGRATGFSERCSQLGAEEIDVGASGSRPIREAGQELMRQLLGERPGDLTAVFAHNDLMALGALRSLNEVGLRCPDHVSIVGYNDSIVLDHVAPPLTTVRFPGFELGERAGYMALELLEGKVDAESFEDVQVVLPAELVVRESARSLLRS